MKISARYFIGLLASVFMLAGVLASPALAENGNATAKVLFNNDKVRVLEVTYKPGAEGKSRKRGFRVMRALTSGTLQRTYADGKTEMVGWKAGEVKVFEADKAPFATKNVGTSELVLYAVAPKRSKD